MEWLDEEALARTHTTTVKFVRRLGGNKHAADDAAREAIADAWERTATGIANPKPETPLEFTDLCCKLAYSQFLTRDRKRHDGFSLDDAAFQDAVESGAAGGHKPRQIEFVYLRETVAAINKLPRRQRAVLLSLARGYNAIDIADKWRVPLFSVFSRIEEGRKFLEMIGFADDETLYRSGRAGEVPSHRTVGL